MFRKVLHIPKLALLAVRTRELCALLTIDGISVHSGAGGPPLPSVSECLHGHLSNGTTFLFAHHSQCWTHAPMNTELDNLFGTRWSQVGRHNWKEPMFLWTLSWIVCLILGDHKLAGITERNHVPMNTELDSLFDPRWSQVGRYHWKASVCLHLVLRLQESCLLFIHGEKCVKLFSQHNKHARVVRGGGRRGIDN